MPVKSTCPVCLRLSEQINQRCSDCGAAIPTDEVLSTLNQPTSPDAKDGEFPWPLIGVCAAAIFISIGAFTFFGSSTSLGPTSTQSVEGSSSPAINPSVAAMRIQRSAQESVESHLRDPSSAEFRNQDGFCGEVNSKNALGEYTGFQRYIAAGPSVILERDSGLPASEFAKVWALCDR